MIKKKSRKMAAFLAAVLVAALCLCQAAFAAESAGIEEGRDSTLSIDLEGQDKKATMALYYVGAWDGSLGAYVLTNGFEGADVPLAELMAEDGMTVEEMETACATLVRYARDNGIQAQETKETEGGKLQFGPAGTGLYLVAQAGEDSTFKVASFLTTLPLLEDGVWDYAVEAHPKNAVVPVAPAPTEAPTQPDGNGGNGGSSGGSTGRARRSSDGGSSTTIDDEGVALDTIEDEATPLGQILDTIEDALTPLAALLPKTGDGSIAYLPLILAFMASGAGIILFAVKRKRYV